MGVFSSSRAPSAWDIDPLAEREIKGAVALVVAGHASRIVFVNFSGLTDLLPRALALGLESGVSVRLDGGPTGYAIIVERAAVARDDGIVPR